MNVLFVSAEVDPFAKVGGLADVVGSLPKALRSKGIDARVLMPYYGFIDQTRYNIAHLFSFQFERRNGIEYVVPAFRVGGDEIWGATAMVLAEFLTLLGWPEESRR